MTDVETAPVGSSTRCWPTTLMADLLFARRLSERMWNLQRQGRLTTVAPLAGPGGRGRRRVRGLDLATDWLVPYYRDATGYGALGDEFVEQLVVYWRGHPDGGRIPDGVRVPARADLARHAAAPRRRARVGPRAARRARRGVHVHRRRRDVGGRLLRGHQPRRRAAGAAHRRRASTTGGRSPRPSSARPRPRRSRRRAPPRASPACASTATTCSRCSRRRATRAGRAGRGRRAHPARAVTYRMGAHTNSDDPTRYVPDDELADWRTRDPIERFRDRAAGAPGRGTTTRHEAASAAVEERLERIIDARWRARSIPTAALDHVVAQPSARSRAQHAEIARAQRDACAHRADDIGLRPTARRRPADPKQEVCRGEHDDARGDPRDAARRDGARRTRRAARRGHRARTAACSAPPTARSSGSARGACSTRRSPSRRSSARRSGCRSPGSCRSPRSSSAASPCRRTTSSSASSPASGTAAGVASTAR